MDKAKLFWSGRSQAVRLPKGFRFTGSEVLIRKHGNSVILEPIAENWDWLESISGPIDEDFQKASEEKLHEQDRPELDELFNE